MTFRATVELSGRSATGFVVPPEVVETLGAGRRPPVVVTVAGFSYRTTVAARGDRYLVPLSGERREAAGVAAGDEVDVTIELDTEPREVAAPPDLAAALAADPGAAAAFGWLGRSERYGVILPLLKARTPATRARVPGRALERLTDLR